MATTMINHVANKPKMAKLARVEADEDEEDISTSTTEEEYTDADGNTHRVIRTITRKVIAQPVIVQRQLTRNVTYSSTEGQVTNNLPIHAAPIAKPTPTQRGKPTVIAVSNTPPKPPRTIPITQTDFPFDESETHFKYPPETRLKATANTFSPITKPVTELKRAQQAKLAPSISLQARSPITVTKSLDIPFADEASRDLDVPYDLVPASKNNPKLNRAASMKRRNKAYSVTDASDVYTATMRSPQPWVVQPQPTTTWARQGPREERQPRRPHSFHGSYIGLASPNNSFMDDPDGEVYSFTEYSRPQPPASHGRAPLAYRESYTQSQAPVVRTQSMLLQTSQAPGITITTENRDDSTRRYKQNNNKAASLSRAASMQLRAYKNKASIVRYGSLSDDLFEEPPDPTPRRKLRLAPHEKISFKSCVRCGEKHVSTNPKLTFDEFHDQFFHTQWPSRTIIICELHFKPSERTVKFKVTSCNSFSTNENDDTGTHAEVFLSEFIHEKVIPNLLGGDLERLNVNIWMNNSPCNQPNNKCSERILDAFETLQTLVADATLNIAFSHLSHLQDADDYSVRNINLHGLVCLMANTSVNIRQFTGYDWLELIMVRTEHPEKWLKLQNGDLRNLISERYDKDAKNRQSLKEMIYRYKTAMVEDINHIKRAIARINVI